jgi:hypothetical protein
MYQPFGFLLSRTRLKNSRRHTAPEVKLPIHWYAHSIANCSMIPFGYAANPRARIELKTLTLLTKSNYTLPFIAVLCDYLELIKASSAKIKNREIIFLA